MQKLLEDLARFAGEHPLLIGALLLFVLASSALHAMIIGGHVVLAFSTVLRRQVAEVKDLRGRFGDEWQSWRDVTIEILRFRKKSGQEIREELSKNGIDPQDTAKVLAAMTAEWLARQKSEHRHEAPASDATDPRGGVQGVQPAPK